MNCLSFPFLQYGGDPQIRKYVSYHLGVSLIGAHYEYGNSMLLWIDFESVFIFVFSFSEQKGETMQNKNTWKTGDCPSCKKLILHSFAHWPWSFLECQRLVPVPQMRKMGPILWFWPGGNHQSENRFTPFPRSWKSFTSEAVWIHVVWGLG